MASDLTKALVRHCSADPRIVRHVGYSDGGYWLFRNKLPVSVEKSSKSAVVFWCDGSWAEPARTHTARTPRLYVDVISDPTRTEQGTILTADAEEKADELLMDLDRILHRPHGEIRFFDLSIISSHRLFEPERMELRDGPDLAFKRIEYGVTLG